MFKFLDRNIVGKQKQQNEFNFVIFNERIKNSN